MTAISFLIFVLIIFVVFDELDFCLAVNPVFSQNLTVTEGKDVTLSCILAPTDKHLARSWTKGTSIIFGNSRTFLQDVRWTLSNEDDEYVAHLKNANIKDEGLYTCTVYGSDDSNQRVLSNIYLTINKDESRFRNAPPSFSDVTRDLVVDEGSDVVLKCEAQGRPKPRIKWRHLIPSADGIRATSQFLPLGTVQRGSGGRYECIADNDVLLPVKHTFQLTVNYPPELDLYKSKAVIKAQHGSRISLDCVASSVPTSTFTWVHPGGREITSETPDDGYIVVDVPVHDESSVESKLYVASVQDSDFGNYTCVAVNSKGTASHTISVMREYAPPTRPPPFSLFGRRAVNNINEDEGPGGSAVSVNNFLLRIVACSIGLCFHTAFVLAVV